MAKKRNLGKVIIFDILAGFCFLGVILFGWLPGPGGIPLLILGLSLLAANHEWAEHWLNTAKHKGISFRKWIFPNKLGIQRLYDTLCALVFGFTLYITLVTTNRLIAGAATVFLISSLFVFLMNRNRIDDLTKSLKKIRR